MLHFRDYGSYIDDLIAGRTVAIRRCRGSTCAPADGASALEAINARVFVNMPVTEHGGFVALLYLNHEGPREWSDEDLAFIREVAERTRTATAPSCRGAGAAGGPRSIGGGEAGARDPEPHGRAGRRRAQSRGAGAEGGRRRRAARPRLSSAPFSTMCWTTRARATCSMRWRAPNAAHFDGFGMPRATAVFAPTFRGEGVIRSDDILTDARYGKNAPHKGMPEGTCPFAAIWQCRSPRAPAR